MNRSASVNQLARRVLRACADLVVGLPLLVIPLFRPYRLYLLSTCYAPERRRWIDRLLYRYLSAAWFRFEYWPEKDPDVRESKKGLLMGGLSGLNWAKSYNSQPIDLSAKCGSLTCNEAYPIYSTLLRMLSDQANGINRVVQIGSSGGKEAAWVAERFPAVQCIGTDIYPEVVEYARQTHKLKNLRFELVPAKDIGQLLPTPQGTATLVFSSGSLAYVQPEHIEVFFAALSSSPNIRIVLLEQASVNDGDPLSLDGSKPIGNFTYTHNYRWYAERNMILTQQCDIIYPYIPSDPIHGHLGHYFYIGVSASIAPNALGKPDGG